jgi:hypothetical protein
MVLSRWLKKCRTETCVCVPINQFIIVLGQSHLFLCVCVCAFRWVGLIGGFATIESRVERMKRRRVDGFTTHDPTFEVLSNVRGVRVRGRLPPRFN